MHTRNKLPSQVNGQPVVAVAQKMARRADLIYVTDEGRGIARVRHGAGFVYRGPSGRSVHNAAALSRIRSLAIPPAWQQVWICSQSRGHLQATGRDARGRKQYLYHPQWTAVRDAAKFERLAQFGTLLPRIRRRVARDLRRQGLPRQKVLATLVRLLESTMIRVGNEEYAKANHSYGLTTLRDRHAKIRGKTIEFNFRGKSGKRHAVKVTSPRLARIVKRCQDLPGQELFQYVDAQGEVQSVGSADVNQYLRDASDQDITAKDFRTWAGTLLAAECLCRCGPSSHHAASKRAVNDAVRKVAEQLRNTMAICRKCYIHPAIIDAYVDGSLLEGKLGRLFSKTTRMRAGKRKQEKLLIDFLRAAGRPRISN